MRNSGWFRGKERRNDTHSMNIPLTRTHTRVLVWTAFISSHSDFFSENHIFTFPSDVLKAIENGLWWNPRVVIIYYPHKYWCKPYQLPSWSINQNTIESLTNVNLYHHDGMKGLTPRNPRYIHRLVWISQAVKSNYRLSLFFSHRLQLTSIFSLQKSL